MKNVPCSPGCPVARLPGETYRRFDQERLIEIGEPCGQLPPAVHRQYDATMRDRHAPSVHFIVQRVIVRTSSRRRTQVTDELVAEEIEIDPPGIAAAFAATEHADVKSA